MPGTRTPGITVNAVGHRIIDNEHEDCGSTFGSEPSAKRKLNDARAQS
jgi:hypothetical protein